MSKCSFKGKGFDKRKGFDLAKTAYTSIETQLEFILKVAKWL